MFHVAPIPDQIPDGVYVAAMNIDFRPLLWWGLAVGFVAGAALVGAVVIIGSG